jgi:uncharacterized protein (TIGR00730 family)
MRRICVFCGSSGGGQAVYADAARRFGTALAGRGLGLVYGGGHVGLMGVVADAVLAAGGRVEGVIPRALVEKELAHQGLARLHVVETMHQRKALMADLADAFAALPGGFGTGDELFEVLTWAQLGLHAKPVGLLNTAGYFDALLAWIDHVVTERFLRPEYRERLRVATEPEPFLRMLLEPCPTPHVEKWIKKEDV